MNALRYVFARTGLLALLCVGLALAGCGGGDPTSAASASTNCAAPTPQDPQGCVYVGITDAPGDFLTYTVNVTSLQLTRADGVVVQMLPNAVSVDFAQYSNLTEFLTGVSMPPGNYTSGSITLNYSGADIEVQDANGNAVQVTPVDQNGNPITANLTLAIDPDIKGVLHVVPGIPRLFNVDFNLAASNIVNLSNNTVTVGPFIDAQVNPAINKLIRMRGPLASVNLGNSSYVIGLRPFYTELNGNGNPYGQMTVYTTSNTVYEINQTGYLGNAGLAALQTAGPTTATVARGTFNFSTDQFVASEVDAGSSVPGGTLDAAHGIVLGISGTSVTLRGATIIRSNQSVVFADDVTVTIGANTKVHEEGDPSGTFAINDISVGQRVLVFGTVSNPNPGSLAMDASNGLVRLEYTRLDATFNGPDGSGTGMLVNVQSFEGRPVSLFNFIGTHSNPASYDVDLNGLSDSGFSANDPVVSYGFVAPFGSAPPDFSAKSVADFATANARLGIYWGLAGTTQPFNSIDPVNGMVPNLTGTPAPVFDNLRRGGVVVALTTLPSSPVIVGNSAGGDFAILQNGSVEVHASFADFVNDLTSRLSAGGTVVGLWSLGGFDSTSNTLTANKIAAVVK
ncbi:MAG: DUF4382 domain-containing protein [Gammaproteobacteria bacterium]|nr:DUF4382 domain-containing protein [Gammaproteobacteria bacterium]MBU6509428.1 DUF4382 domain-containing protein [Gammaproteobacteria bacterium]MDE1983704.1 DUF4382 domain-containing protein [Gammaproteobacteria bacterium]MDE2107904.1 DUF4382 domain-containing protein [Gammaproteobacteria bacterium]MDE2460214.1 DUF4382 domain-containing protein [Gammaproteobacteria bacterium]